LLVYIVYGAVIVNPFPSVQSIWLQFSYQHCRWVYSILETDIVFFTALKATLAYFA
jgi:hypothetical protein